VSESVVNAGFTEVDRTGEATSYVHHLDYMSAKERVQDSKRRSFEALELLAGNTVLDVGCGAGNDVRALAALVGHEGRVIGIDKSQTMIEEARARTAGVDLSVEFRVGDAYAFEFSDASFDRARMDRVLHHLDDPQRAVSELARVVRPGGRIALFEPDFDTLVIDHSDRALTRKLTSFFCESMRSGWVGRQLIGLARRAGFSDLRVQSSPWMFTDYAEAERTVGLDRVVALAIAAGAVGADEAAAWLVGLQAADAAGCFFLAATPFLVSGRKP
jgi:ubiquinone/menaquinone biosynthesis C-methylase UbiE